MKIIVAATSSIFLVAKARWVLSTHGHLSSHVSGVPRPILEVERPIERSFSQLHESACRSTVKWRVRTSNANHCVGDVVHTLGCQKGVGSSEPYLRIPTTDFKVEQPIKRSFFQLHVSAGQNTVKWRMGPSNAHHSPSDVIHTLGCQDEIGSHHEGRLSSHISGSPRPIFKVERPIERFFSPLHVIAGHNPDKWRMRPSNVNHCQSDVIHTLEMVLSQVRTVS